MPSLRNKLIPALIGQEVNDAGRQILALPLRHGGLGLTDPWEAAKTEYKHSTQITKSKTRSWLSTHQTTYIPDTQKTEYDKRRKQNAKTTVMNC